MTAASSPFHGTNRRTRPLAVAIVLSLAIHGTLLAAAGWLWEGKTPPRTPPMISIAVIPEATPKPTPHPELRPSPKKRPRHADDEKVHHAPRPETSPVASAETKRRTPPHPLPDWVTAPPVPPKRPDFQTRAAASATAPQSAFEIAPAAIRKPPATTAKATSRKTIRDTRQTASLAPTVSPGPVSPPTPVSGAGNPAPRYPWLSRQRGEQGRVILNVVVSADGHPKKVHVKWSSGHRRLDEAAASAVRKWRFLPAKRLGHAVAGRTEVPITFRLTN